ncbi:MAG TPA: alpha/beta hydrolase [Burkholderiales bacterium]|jgi:pimeloyl-ACP methyl ester carboxylesterase|nr:alpha/beta hydrolase [Burkholderiales bacterium]
MATFVVAHGAWSAGWAWKKMRPLMRARGHEIFTPTYTGVGERAHLAHKDLDLEAHIADVIGVLEAEDLKNVILLGHSYGGMVATGVADRAARRIAQLVYLDAFAPRDGQSLLDLQTEEARQRVYDGAKKEGEGWRIPPNPAPPDTTPQDLAWVNAHRRPQPLKTFEQKIRLTGAVERLPRTYIYCTKSRPGDVFRQFRDRASKEKGWTCIDLDASHSPNVTAPEALAEVLDSIARRA